MSRSMSMDSDYVYNAVPCTTHLYANQRVVEYEYTGVVNGRKQADKLKIYGPVAPVVRHVIQQHALREFQRGVAIVV